MFSCLLFSVKRLVQCECDFFFFYISNFISTFFLLLYFSSLYSQDLIYQSSLVRGNRKKTVQELFAFFRVDLYKFVWFCLAEVYHFLLCISSKKKQSQCVSSLNWLGFTSLALSILPESLARFFSTVFRHHTACGCCGFSQFQNSAASAQTHVTRLSF